MKKLLFCLMAVLVVVSASAYDLKRVSVHDPSIVWDPVSQTYYIFGSHRAAAKTTDLMSWSTIPSFVNATTFSTPAVTKVKKGGVEYDFVFDAQAWSKRGSAKYDISGNLWAPDVIWNPVMNKWCMYMSVNGECWYSSIVLLTSDNIEGPYVYQAPVVISGFHTGDAYKDTDLEIVLG
ncbi:MAG: hypothetical protein IJ569_02075, partial [Prevotella sp.]|nr:hypothetical protein [Prevotella sp.]